MQDPDTPANSALPAGEEVPEVPARPPEVRKRDVEHNRHLQAVGILESLRKLFPKADPERLLELLTRVTELEQLKKSGPTSTQMAVGCIFMAFAAAGAAIVCAADTAFKTTFGAGVCFFCLYVGAIALQIPPWRVLEALSRARKANGTDRAR